MKLKTYEKVIALVFIVLMFLFVSFGLSYILKISANRKIEASKNRIELYSEIMLPDDTKEIFNYKDNTFTGLAGQYTIFELTEEPIELLNSEDFTNKYGFDYVKDENMEKIFISYLEMFHIHEEYYPDFYNEYRFASKNGVYIIYFKDSLKLYCLICGH